MSGNIEIRSLQIWHDAGVSVPVFYYVRVQKVSSVLLQ